MKDSPKRGYIVYLKSKWQTTLQRATPTKDHFKRILHKKDHYKKVNILPSPNGRDSGRCHSNSALLILQVLIIRFHGAKNYINSRFSCNIFMIFNFTKQVLHSNQFYQRIGLMQAIDYHMQINIL